MKTSLSQTDAVAAMERCKSDIRTWMLTDKLKLNDDKTEFMLIGAKLQLSKVNIDSLTVGSNDVAPVTVARNLGAWFYSNLNLQEQIHKTCKSGFFHSIQYSAYPKVSVPGIFTNFGPCFYHWSYRLLQQPSIGMVYSRSVHLLKMQRLQNATARIIFNVSRYSRITPVLCSLHWLPVKFPIDFKILVMRLVT